MYLSFSCFFIAQFFVVILGATAQDCRASSHHGFPLSPLSRIDEAHVSGS